MQLQSTMEPLNGESHGGENRFRQMIDLLPTAIYTTDAQGRLTHYNPACIEFSGRTPELGTDHWCVTWKLYHPDGTPLPHDECPMAIALKEGRVIHGAEAIAERPDGTRIWFTPYPTPLFDAAGNIVGGINMLVDITKRKQAEQALRESEERQNALVSVLTDVPWSTDAAGAFVVPQEAYSRYTGKSWEELRGLGWVECIHPDDRDRLVAIWKQAVATRTTYNALCREWHGPTQQWRHVVARGTPVVNADGSVREWVGSLTDVHEQRHGEQALVEAEERYRDLFNSMDEGYCIIEVLFDDHRNPVDYLFVEVNGAFERQSGMQGVVGKRMREFVPEIESHWLANYGRVARTGEPIRFAGEYKGLQRWFEVYAFRVGMPRENKVAVLFTDITGRKREEQVLAESESFTRSAFESSPDCVKVLDGEGRLLRMNARGMCLMELDDFASIAGGRWSDLWPDEKRPDALSALETARTGGVGRFQGYCPTARGTPKWWDVNVASIRDVDGNVTRFISVSRDLTDQKRSEEATARLAAIVTSSEDAIVSKDLNGVITSWNQGAEHVFGYTAEEAIGKPITLLIPDDSLDEESRILDRIRRGEMISHYETIRRRKDGSLIEISLTISPIRNADGVVIGASKVARDITERKRAELRVRDSEVRFRMVADNITQLAWTCDRLGNVTWYNQRWLDYTGLSFDEMQGWNWSKVQHPDHLDRVVKRVQYSAETGEPWEDTFPLRGKNGEYRWFLSRAVPIHNSDGKVVCWFGTNTDVTEQREMADELRRNAAEMAEADNRKNEFLALLAHELRNPLAPIGNVVQVLKMSAGDEAAVRSASELIERQIGQMVRLVDDLLDVSRITRNKIALRRGRIELASIVHHAVEAARALKHNMEHQLDVHLPSQAIYVNGDATRLAQVVGNLLSNACKFTDKGGRISLTVEAVDDKAVIRVKDNGIGIAAEQHSRIFEMFTQVDTSLERSVGGLGIGLSLVKNLVELHEGTIEVHSDGVGRGSEFVVRLPLMKAVESPLPQSAAVEPMRAPARRILVVDDNRDSAASLSTLLRLLGNETRTAADGLEAVETAEVFRPDVMLLDIGLPKLNGYEACRRIREQPWGREMRIVALTGWGQEEDRQKSKDAGFDHHLVKPVNLKDLEKLLAEPRLA